MIQLILKDCRKTFYKGCEVIKNPQGIIFVHLDEGKGLAGGPGVAEQTFYKSVYRCPREMGGPTDQWSQQETEEDRNFIKKAGRIYRWSEVRIK